MRITFDLTEEEFTPSQQQLVREALGLADAAALQQAMRKLCKAATMEYLGMFVEKGMPSRADEVRQDRLYFLINHYYQNRLPPETEVSSVFQLTASQSRTLLRNTRSRYRTKIGSQVQASAKAVVTSAARNETSGNWEMLIDSEVILEELNLVVAKKGPTLNTVRLKAGSAGQYIAEEDTYQLLREEYGIE